MGDILRYPSRTMVNTYTPKARPFWAQAVGKKSLTSRQKWPPVMVAFRCLQPWSQTCVSTRTLTLIIPRVASFPTIGIEQIDSKQEFFAAAMLREICNLRCEFRLLPTHTICRRFDSRCLCEGSASFFQWWRILFQSRGPFGV